MSGLSTRRFKLRAVLRRASNQFALSLCLICLLVAMTSIWIFGSADATGSKGPSRSAAPPAPPGAAAQGAGAPAPSPSFQVSMTAAPTQQAELDEIGWKAVERIDAKLANAVVLMTFFVGLIAIVLGLYEFFKVREVERIRDDLKASIQSLFDERFEASNHEYQRRLAKRLLEQVETHTNRIADDQLRLAAIRHRIMICYVTNDLNPNMGQPITVANMHSCIELERALNQLGASSPKDNLMALSLINAFAQHVSEMTAGQILNYLVTTNKSGALYTWDNQELCNDIVRTLERRTGICATDGAFD